MALSLLCRRLPAPPPEVLAFPVRRARPGEGTALVAIRRAAILGDRRTELTPECRRAWADTADAQAGPDDFETWISDPDHLILVPAGNVPLAYIHADLPIGHLRALFVRPAASGQGLATGLLSHALASGAAMGVARWRVDSSPWAENIYRRAGFRPERRTVTPLRDGFLLPTVTMRRP
jgi:GNAT superfamily N-acetyltransferase